MRLLSCVVPMRTEEIVVIFSLAFINSRLTDYLTYTRLIYGIKMRAVQAEAQEGKYVVHNFRFLKTVNITLLSF